MIKNDRQYRITKSAATKFAAALEQLETAEARPGVDPLIQRAEREALKGQLDDLHAELRAYEELASGQVSLFESASLTDLPASLIRARIAAGMSQRELAEKLGLKEQQIQRYEATDYQQASLARLLEIANTLKIAVRKDLLPSTPLRSASGFFRRLTDLGIPKDFVLSRLVPKDLASRLSEDSNSVDQVLLAATRSVTHVFGWTAAAVLGEGQPWLDAGVLGAARFKVSATADQKSLEAYSLYAHFLALLLLKTTEDLPSQSIPTDPDVLRKEILERHGAVSFRTTLRYCWDLGIPVLPLRDGGAFHGACWRVNGRNVIVLKQGTQSLARWLFDLLHELRHAAEDPTSPTHVVIEQSEQSWARTNSEEEKEAYWFAGEATLGGRAEELVHKCVVRAKGEIPRLKRVISDVANAENVDAAALANYMAFRLSLQGENWWGTAANLQPKNESPWEIARDELLFRANLGRLSGIDRELFMRALTEV